LQIAELPSLLLWLVYHKKLFMTDDAKVTPAQALKLRAYLAASSRRYVTWRKTGEPLTEYHTRDETERIVRGSARHTRNPQPNMALPLENLVMIMSYLPSPRYGKEIAAPHYATVVDRCASTCSLMMFVVRENASVIRPRQPR